MKKSFIYSVAAVFALAACSKEADVQVPTGETVTITAAVDQTRSTEEHASFSWATDEQISVGTSDGEYVAFDVADAAKGLFSYTFPGEAPDLLVAVSPVQANAEFADATFYEVELPAVYNNYDPSKGVTNALMIGTPDPNVPNKFLFRHAAALVKVTYANVPVGTTSFVFEADENLTGTVTLGGLTTNDIEITNGNSELNGSEVWINLPQAVAVPNTTLSFYVPVPTGDYSLLSIYLANAGGKIASTEKTMDRTGKSALHLNRADVFTFPTITLAAEPIVENFTSSKASNNQYNCNSSLSTADNRKDFDFTWSPEGSGTVFNNGIKLGKSGGNGSVTSSDILGSIPAGSTFTVKVYAAVWTTDGGELVVSYNGNDLQAAPANDPITSTDKEYSASDFTLPTEFVFMKSADADNLTIASSAGRILIDKVEIVLGGTPVPVQSLTVTPSSENPETVSYEGGVMTYSVTAENIDSWDAESSDEAFVVAKNNDGFVVTVAENESSTPRSATITVTGGTKTVTVTINQEGAPAVIEALTVAQFLAKQPGDTYYQLTGKLTNLENPTFGNFTLVDETGSVYVYGLTKTQVASNDRSFSSIGVGEGDFVTLVGKRAVYSGTAQVGGPAYYVSHIPAPVISVNPTNKTVLASVTSVEIAITSNADWTITGEGISANPSSGSGNGTATLTFAARTDAGDAQLVATVKADIDPTVYETVTITQHGTDYVAPTGWVETDLAEIGEGDVFVIVGNNQYALPNDGGTSNPEVVGVTVSNGTLTGTIPANLTWNVSGNATDGYTFYPNGDSSSWLYCSTTAASGSNTNMRVGTGNRKLFKLNSNNYLVTADTYTARYLSIYNDQDWRGYTTASNAAQIKFYRYSGTFVTVATPSFSVAEGTYTSSQSVEISCATSGATIYYTLDGSTPDNTKSVYSGALTISSTTTVKAIAIKDGAVSAIASATYTITGGGTETKTLEFTVASHTGWDVSEAEAKNGYYLLYFGKSITSPSVSVSTIKSIVIKMRTFGGSDANKVKIFYGNTEVGTATATSSTLTDITAVLTTTTVSGGPAAFRIEGAAGDTSKGEGISEITIAYN